MEEMNYDTDSESSSIIDSEKNPADKLLTKLAPLFSPLSEIPNDKFSHFDLRGGSDRGGKLITDHMYVLHITYLVWRKNRKLNEAIH